MLTCEFQGRCIFPHGVTSLLLSGWQGRKPSGTALRGCSEYIVGRLLEERGVLIRTQGVAEAIPIQKRIRTPQHLRVIDRHQ